jgi:hypothetical protein
MLQVGATEEEEEEVVVNVDRRVDERNLLTLIFITPSNLFSA